MKKSSSNIIHPARIVIILLLIGITSAYLHTSSTVQPVPIKKSLSHFPKTIGSYTLSNSLQSSADIIEMLGVNDYIQYNYDSDDGYQINLYVGYYRAVGVEGSYHSPKNCIPGGGWGIDTVKTVELQRGIEGNNQSVVSQMLIRRATEYQVVYYWFQNRGRIIASEYWEKIYQVLDAIVKSRRDGTFVRIISHAKNGDIERTEARVKSFAEKVIGELEDFLPGAEL